MTYCQVKKRSKWAVHVKYATLLRSTHICLCYQIVATSGLGGV